MATVTELRTTLALEHARNEGYHAKVMRAMARITEAANRYRRPYVAFSGGKDSLVCVHMAARVLGDVQAHWTDDELEYPETVEMMAVLAQDPSLLVTLGGTMHAGWFVPWVDRPYWREPLPGAVRKDVSAEEWMARRGHNLTILGTRATESRKRNAWFREIQVKHPEWWHSYPSSGGTGRRCCPIWDWTEDDVWAYIAVNRLPVNPVYDTLEQMGIARDAQRVGPLPLTPRTYLAGGWPDLLERLETRYGNRWI